MQPQTPQQLDQDVVRLAKSIRKIESGDNFQARGKSGEYGGYQYTQDTWAARSKKYLGRDVPLEAATPEEQNEVQYKWMKEKKDAGYDVGQIASMHNAGEGRPNAHLEGFKGTNKFGVQYDVPAYAEKVARTYQELKSQQGTAPQGGTQSPIGYAPPKPPEQASQEASGQEQSGGFLDDVGNFAKGLISAPATIVARPFQAVAALAGAKTEDIDKFDLGGIIAPTPKNTGDVIKDVGRGAETIALGVGGGTAAGAGSSLLKGKVGSALVQSVKGGALAGGLTGAGATLEDQGAQTDPGSLIANTAIGTGVGGLIGGALPVAGAALGTVAPIIRGASRNIRKVAEGADNMVQRANMIRSLPNKAEQTALRAGIPDPVVNFIRETPDATKSSFKEMLEMQKKAVSSMGATPEAKLVPARTFLSYVDDISKGSRKATEQLKTIAAKNPTEKVDFSNAFQTYIGKLKERGIEVNPSTGKFTSTGNVPTSELKYYDDILTEIQAVAKNDPNLTRSQAHQLRQRLFATLDSATRQGGQVGQRPYGPQVDMDVQTLRQALADIIGPEYKEAARNYATNEAVLREVAKIAGTTIDEIPTKDLKFAEVLMRTMGNASDRPKTLINDVVEAAKRNGSTVDQDILAQLQFADLLESIYGTSQNRAMRGQVSRGVSDAATDIAGDFFAGNRANMISKIFKAVAGQSEDDQIRAFEALITEAQRSGLIR